MFSNMKKNWTGLKRFSDDLLREIYSRNKVIKFDSYKETEKAWIITVNEKEYTLPKSKTILFHGDNTIQMPRWLYEKNIDQKS